MDASVTARDLRSLLALARKLRALADEPLTAEADRSLYLSAAAALQARASRLASGLPDAPGKIAADSPAHVNLLI